MSSEWTGDETVASLGEAETLSRILPLMPAARDTLLGPGDDAALVSAPDGRFVVTTDLMVEGPDFRRAWSEPHDLGWKAAASNLSDVAAMGARPTALVVALAAPTSTPIAVLEGIARGLSDGCAAMAPGAGVVGGDLSTAPVLMIAVTAFGDLGGRAAVTRSGARAGDVVAVSGVLGDSGRGLDLLFRLAVDHEGEPDARLGSELRGRDAGVRWHLAPTPPVGDGVRAAEAGATAMLDLSDGLALDATRLARASGVVIALDSSSLGDDPHAALSGGEDHSLLATFPSGTPLPGGFRPIGTVVPREHGAQEHAHPVTLDGIPLAQVPGWDPYAWSPEAR
ncbi:thiamine-phosphate kinase [Frondihabitans australicus]|uniref:Thiamine-monophosphate kinase n=1 Tax=Frondihabitans australicus TaxID=386892 RepID=A0A495ICK0_9MICO|nr:thiamine-phosphate kinase [Frondihabitans australicus]RKR73649.1 thiamine-phosphate kinase [Frondihabitans australicus]